MEKRNRPIKIDPTKHYWRVSVIETVGTGAGAVNIECIVHDIPADNKLDAGTKALLQYMRKNPGSLPKLKSIEREHYSRPIQIW